MDAPGEPADWNLLSRLLGLLGLSGEIDVVRLVVVVLVVVNTDNLI